MPPPETLNGLTTMSKKVTLISQIDGKQHTFVLNEYNDWETEDESPLEPADLQDALDRIWELENKA
jgi:hypothetical protein